MNEVGFRKDRESLFANEAGERFQSAFWVTAGTQTERLMALITSEWQKLGFDIRPRVIPAAEARDNQVRSTFPGLLNYGISPSSVGALESFITAQIGTPANRWGGQNRGGWSSAEYDRLFEAFDGTLERSGRIQRLADLARVISEDLPTYPLFSNLGAITHLATLKGPEVGTPDTLVHWNIHEWELQ
jgi:ABC-type transport system substrate-binding protein